MAKCYVPLTNCGTLMECLLRGGKSLSDDNMVQVMLCYENRNYLLCSLKRGSMWQVPLDLNFQEGTKIAFTSNGRGHVHLTGYLIPDEDDDLDLDELEEEEDDEDEEVPKLVDKHAKRKALNSPKDGKEAKRMKQLNKEPTMSSTSEEEDENEDEDEDNFNEDGINDNDGSDEVDEDEDDEDSSEEDEEEEEEEEEEVVEKVTKQQQKKNKQNQQQQAKKQDKQKLVNGNDRQEQSKQQQKKQKEEQQQQNVQTEQKKRVVEGGVQIQDLLVGNGIPAKAGKFISVYYVGRLKNGQKFDSTTRGEGFKFRLGKGEVIKGWDVGITGMKVGGKRRITIPPGMA